MAPARPKLPRPPSAVYGIETMTGCHIREIPRLWRPMLRTAPVVDRRRPRDGSLTQADSIAALRIRYARQRLESPCPGHAATTARTGKASFSRLLLVRCGALTTDQHHRPAVYLVDTHIHDLDGDESGIVQLLSPPATGLATAQPRLTRNALQEHSRRRQPGSKCPLCRLLYGGQYLTPKLVSLLIITGGGHCHVRHRNRGSAQLQRRVA